MLTESDVGTFQNLWLKETGQEISEEQARKYADNLLGLVGLVLDPSIANCEQPP